jgi:hypothetical protein
MEEHQISIHSNGVTSKILIDGVEPERVKSFTLKHTAGEVSMLQLEIFALDLVYEGPAIVATTTVAATVRNFEKVG